MELFTRKGGITIHYHTAGEGYPVVLIHTAYDNAAIFKDLSKKLAESFQVVLIEGMVILINQESLNLMNLQMISFYCSIIYISSKQRL